MLAEKENRTFAKKYKSSSNVNTKTILIDNKVKEMRENIVTSLIITVKTLARYNRERIE